MNCRNFFSLLCVVSVCTFLGCSEDGEDLPEVNLDAAEVAKQIMAAYDADGNGEVSKSELKKCEGLQMLTIGEEQMQPAYRLDSDESGTYSEQEFAAKMAACFEDKRMSFSCKVNYGGRNRPLEGATVKLVPMPFMGDVPTATGDTNDEGLCGVMGSDGVNGVVPGVYRVEITHPDKKISSRFNTESKLSIGLNTTNPYAQSGTQEFIVK